MISLKKYLDMAASTPSVSEPVDAALPAAQADELLLLSLESYRNALRGMGESGARACPAVGSDLQQSLLHLAETLAANATSLTQTSTQAGDYLLQFGERTADYLQARTAEVKELLLVLAQTAESVGQRDHQYAGQLNQITLSLRSISNLEDLTLVRASIMQQAGALKTYVEQMEQDSHKLVAKLQTEATSYESKLKNVEELASRDTLTGVANRRDLESRLEQCMVAGNSFCAVMLDLNGLKQINDKHGHLAGDSLLQQFAHELRSSLRSSDLVGRWGGDEFLIVMAGEFAGAQAQIERLRKWIFGEYTIRPGKGLDEVKVNVDAAVGLAQWQSGDTAKTIVERADTAMYLQKKEMKAKAQSAR